MADPRTEASTVPLELQGNFSAMEYIRKQEKTVETLGHPPIR